jgi:hypothetical protein
MKKLFVLFTLVATISLLNVSDLKAIPQGAEVFNFGYFTLCNGQNTYNMNFNVTASQEGTFTFTGGFGTYWPMSCFFSSSQSKGNWTVTFNMIEFTNGGWWSFTSYQFDEDYTSEGLLFNPGLFYHVTYTVTSNI